MMETPLQIVFAINIALLIVHEMDAVHWKEWIILFGIEEDQRGRNVFLLAHIPFFLILLFALVYSDTTFGRVISIAAGLFLTVHYFLHRRALSQGLFNEKVSFGVISAMLIGSILQVIITVANIFNSAN